MKRICVLLALLLCLCACGEVAMLEGTSVVPTTVATTTPVKTTAEESNPIVDLLAAQVRQLLIDKPAFDEIKDVYGLEITAQSKNFLYTRSSASSDDEYRADIELNFQKDKEGIFRLVAVAAPADIILPEYIGMDSRPWEETPFTPVRALGNSVYHFYDEQFTYFENAYFTSDFFHVGGPVRISLQLSANTFPQAEELPGKSYLGTWHTDENGLDSLEICDISGGTIAFYMGIYRLFGMDAVAKIDGDQIKFSYGNMNGTLEFQKGGVVVTIIESDFSYIKSGKTFEFGVKGKFLTKADFDSIRIGSNAFDVDKIDDISKELGMALATEEQMTLQTWHALQGWLLVIDYERNEDGEFIITKIEFS